MKICLTYALVIAITVSALCMSAIADPVYEYLGEDPVAISYFQQGWGSLGLGTCAYEPGKTPLPLQIKDRTYTRGLGTHAAGEIVIDLNGYYEAFESEVGLQPIGGTGSVVFQVYMDGKKLFDSGVMHDSDAPRQIAVSVKCGEKLRLIVTDAGDGITCDTANWANARLLRSSGVPQQSLSDISDSARVVTWDPARMDGCDASRIQEYLAQDVYLETDLVPNTDGTYTAPVSADGRSCIGLQWLGNRAIKEAGIRFLAPTQTPPIDQVQIQGWFGESLWQGAWQNLTGNIEQQNDGLLFHVAPAYNSGIVVTPRIRWILPAGASPFVVAGLPVATKTLWLTADLTLQMEDPTAGQNGEIKITDGFLVAPDGTRMPGTQSWDLSQPLHLKVRYHQPGAVRSDRTALQVLLPSGAFAVAVEDVVTNRCVYVKNQGFFVSSDASGITLDQYAQEIADRQTVLQRVRSMPDQTFAQSLARTHHDVQNNGPMLISLACDNAKFTVLREGGVQFDTNPDGTGGMGTLGPSLSGPYYVTTGQAIPIFGGSTPQWTGRYLDGGWYPVPVTTYQAGSVSYSARSFVTPYDDSVSGWLNPKALCVMELIAKNNGTSAASAAVNISFSADVSKTAVPSIQSNARGYVVAKPTGLMALVDTASRGTLTGSASAGVVTLSGTLAAGAESKCYVYIPGWAMQTSEYTQLTGGSALLNDVRSYWDSVMSSAAQVSLPDTMLTNVIKASQVHCLVDSRNELNGALVLPWIAASIYGPLESEAHSIVRGMDLWGHPLFTQKSLEYFISKYNTAGFLTTGYTMFGTSWHLWTIGQHYKLDRDTAWLAQIDPEVTRVCRWIVAQTQKTKRISPLGEKMPENGLMPPGVLADWNSFAYHFMMNSYYYAALQWMSDALSATGNPEAPAFAQAAQELEEETLRAYAWAKARTPVLPLQDGTWVCGYPSQLHSPGPLGDFFPNQDGGRSWAYDVELGANHMVSAGVLDASGTATGEMMDHLEDVQFLADGWFDYSSAQNHADWFNLGGFAKVQPYYCRNAEIYAMRDDVKPFVRSYFNSLASSLNVECLSLWEHFAAHGAWDKTHETGLFLQQSRFMLVFERGDSLWLAPFVTNNWLEDGMGISVQNMPTNFGNVSYTVTSHANSGYIEATIQGPVRTAPSSIVLRLRHPQGQHIQSVTVNGAAHAAFDPANDTITLPPTAGPITVRANY